MYSKRKQAFTVAGMSAQDPAAAVPETKKVCIPPEEAADFDGHGFQ